MNSLKKWVVQGASSKSAGSRGLIRLPELLAGFDEYLIALKGQALGTSKRYIRSLEQFFEWLEKSGGAGGSADIAYIRTGDVERWMKDLYYHQGQQKGVTRAVKLAAIKSFWQYLLYQGYIKVDPMERVPSPKTSRPVPQKFSEAQLKKIFAAPDLSTRKGIRDLAILKVLFGAGPRVNELKELEMGSLKFEGADIYLQFQGKGNKERLVRLRKNPSDSLKLWLEIREEFVSGEYTQGKGPVFCSMARNRPGRPLSANGYNQILKLYAARMGITDEKVFVHKMRSTFATALYDAGFDIYMVSLIMGHESVETTKRYIVVSEKALKKTAIPNDIWRRLESSD